MINCTVVGPAYGTQYSLEAQALEAWQNGKDFKILPDGPYCSIRDFTILDTVIIWYTDTEYTVVIKE